MNEIVERLREYSGNDPDGVRHREAASEIERLRVALVERLHDIPADLCWTEDKGAHRNIPAGAIAHEAADEIERLTAEYDDYVIRANANVCELNREIERLRAHIDTLVQERDAERQTYNDAIARHLSEIKRLKAQLARTETALDNEFNSGIALCAEIERLQKI